MTVQEVMQISTVTLKVALTSTAAGLLPGVAVGWWLARRRSHWRDSIEALVSLPLVLPPVAAGLGLLTVLAGLQSVTGVDIVFTWEAAAIAALVMSFPLLVRSVQSAMAAVPATLEQAAETLGATPWDVFVTVTLPLARRGIVNGLLLAFARSVGEFGATMLVAGIVPGSTETLATGIYSRIINNHDADAGVLAAMAALLGFWSIWVANRMVAPMDQDE